MVTWEDITKLTWSDLQFWTTTTDLVITIVLVVLFLVLCIVAPIAWYYSHKYAEDRTIMLENGPEAYSEDDPRRDKARRLRAAHLRELNRKNAKKEEQRQRFREGRTLYQRYNAVVQEIVVRWQAFKEGVQDRIDDWRYGSLPPVTTPPPSANRPVELDPLNV